MQVIFIRDKATATSLHLMATFSFPLNPKTEFLQHISNLFDFLNNCTDMTETEITDLKKNIKMFLPEVSSAVTTKKLIIWYTSPPGSMTGP